MNIAIIGLGYWGSNHVRVFKELQKQKLIENIIFCDKDKERRSPNNIIPQRINEPFYNDYLDIKTSEIDAVSIVTPSNTHYHIAKYFLNAGIDVFVEKPMTLNSDDADCLIKRAKKNDCILMPGHIFRIHPAIQALKKLIDEGYFGKIYSLSTQRLSLFPSRGDMGVLFALGIHEVDLYCYLLNRQYPDEIQATVGKYTQEKFEENAQINLYFKDLNIMGYSFVSWVNPCCDKKRMLTISGSKRGATIDYLKTNEIKIYNRYIKNGIVFDEGIYPGTLEYKEPLMEELKHFVDCVKNTKQPIADMYAGKRAVEMIELALQSADEGRTIKVDKELRK